MEEVDADGDGYPLWSSTADTERADCDDDNPEVTPLTERYISAGDFVTRREQYTLEQSSADH